MKLLIDARALTDSTSGGVGRVARRLVHALATTCPENEILCFTTGTRTLPLPNEIAELRNVRHIHVSIPNKFWSALSWAGLVSMIHEAEKRAGRVDAVFLPNLGFVGNMRGRSYSLLMHDLSFVIEPAWFSRKTRLWHDAVRAKKLISNASHLFAVSESTKRDAIRLLHIPEERITVIPIGPTIGPVYPANEGVQNSTRSRYILAQGATDPRKNSKTAREAVRLLRQETTYADMEFILLGANPHVRPSDAELMALYANASAFLYPSWYEGYGLPVHEAASVGTPCIASTSGALPETAPPTTLFANPAKPHHWVEAINIALSKPRPQPYKNASSWNDAAAIIQKYLL